MTATDEQIERVRRLTDYGPLASTADAIAAVLAELAELRAEVERLRKPKEQSNG